MMILTDEEIYQATGIEWNSSHLRVAKAQLKQVVEYIDGELICGGRLGEPEQDGKDVYFLDVRGWQALLEEVK